jgi:hypothetical protein
MIGLLSTLRAGIAQPVKRLGYGQDGWVIGVLFSIMSRLALGPIQPHIQWVPGAVSPGVRRHEADHSSPSSAEVKNGGTIPPLPHTSSWRGASLMKPWDHFTFSMLSTLVNIVLRGALRDIHGTHSRFSISVLDAGEWSVSRSRHIHSSRELLSSNGGNKWPYVCYISLPYIKCIAVPFYQPITALINTIVTWQINE